MTLEDHERDLDPRYLCLPEREMIADLLRPRKPSGPSPGTWDAARAPSAGKSSATATRSSATMPHGAQRTATAARARPKPSKLAEPGQLRDYVKANAEGQLGPRSRFLTY